MLKRLLSSKIGMPFLRTHDFQATSGVEIFNRFVKPGDSAALSTLLRSVKILTEARDHELLVHDVGGADGSMMLAFLQELNVKCHISVNEPNKARLLKYQEKQRHYPYLFSSIQVFDNKIEDINFNIPPQRDLILASHVLYYNRHSWLNCENLSDHLFTKLFCSLRVGGTLCVLLQHAPMGNECSHELWEDFIYPLLESTKHGKNKFYASSADFDNALSAFRKQFIFETGDAIDWKIQEKIAEISVPLGEVNTSSNAEGKYPQTESTLKILEFYLKGRSFENLDAHFQKKIINILVTHFKNKNQHNIIHYNKVYSIEVGPVLLSGLKNLGRFKNSNSG